MYSCFYCRLLLKDYYISTFGAETVPFDRMKRGVNSSFVIRNIIRSTRSVFSVKLGVAGIENMQGNTVSHSMNSNYNRIRKRAQ